MSKNKHIVKFGGVRGSIPTDDPDKTHFGGNTSCVEVTTVDGTHIIFDSGTGIRAIGNDIAAQHESAYEIFLFLSHTHWDHILGLPFFAPIHQSFATIRIFGPERANISLEKSVWGLFQSPYFPLAPDDIEANITFTELNTGVQSITDTYSVASSPHPHPNGALSYRLNLGERSLAFITDIEHTKDHLVPAVVEICKDVDILIHDSHFTPEDLPEHNSWGHSSWQEATAVASRSGAKKLFLFHFSPNYSDEDVYAMEKRARQEFPNTVAAYQGLIEEITPA